MIAFRFVRYGTSIPSYGLRADTTVRTIIRVVTSFDQKEPNFKIHELRLLFG